MGTTNIKIASDVLKQPSDSQHVQFLPCTIVSGGTTDVEERFNRFTEKDEKSGTLSNSLRGFPLDGKVVSLPPGYTGLVLEGAKAGLTSQDRDLRPTGTTTGCRGRTTTTSRPCSGWMLPKYFTGS